MFHSRSEFTFTAKASKMSANIVLLFVVYLATFVSGNKILVGARRDELACCNNKWQIEDKTIDGCCDGKPYRTKEHVCCSNKLIEIKVKNSTKKCCGDTPYDVNTQTCCDNKTVAGPFGTPVCCGDRGYDPKSSICCHDHTLIEKGEEELLCCGKESYNVKNQLCCDGKILPVPKGENYQQLFCCGDQIVNFLKKYCCGGKPIDKTFETMGCCDHNNGTIFDIQTDSCCQGVIYRNKTFQDGYNCCGKTIYSRKTHACCFETGKTVEKPAGSNLEDKDEPFDCCNKISVYSLKTHVCCNKMVSPQVSQSTGCCGDRVIDLTTHSCCNDQVVDKPENVACCNKDAWDTKTHACCDNKLVSFEKLKEMPCSGSCLKSPFMVI